MSDKRISALTEQTGLSTGDFLAIDNAGETESKKIDQAYFSGQYSDMQNVLGSKNLMPNEATTQVVSGITFTKYSDGSIKANGTASANINFVLSSSFDLPKGDYILTDGVKNQSYYVDIKNGSTVIARARDDGTFTLAADTTLLSEIWIASGQVVSNVTFYPMVRPANIPNTNYVPFAKSNKELTEDVASLNASLTNMLTWKSLGALTNMTDTLATPMDSSIILLRFFIGDGRDQILTITIPTFTIGASSYKYVTGAATGTGYAVYCGATVNSSTIKIENIVVQGGVPSVYNLNVYYI